MSTRWSLYVVPESWTLKQCMVVGYFGYASLMFNHQELEENIRSENEDDSLYYELIKQPSLLNYTSDDGGDPDHDKIMELLSPIGRLYEFPDALYEFIPELKVFVKTHHGKRYICMN